MLTPNNNRDTHRKSHQSKKYVEILTSQYDSKQINCCLFWVYANREQGTKCVRHWNWSNGKRDILMSRLNENLQTQFRSHQPKIFLEASRLTTAKQIIL